MVLFMDPSVKHFANASAGILVNVFCEESVCESVSRSLLGMFICTCLEIVEKCLEIVKPTEFSNVQLFFLVH